MKRKTDVLQDTDDSSEPLTVYGVPRRYDLVSLLVMSVAFAGLFSMLRSLNASPVFIASLLSCIVVVGLAQAFLFGGRAPRRASLVAGLLFASVFAGIQAYTQGSTLFIANVLVFSIFFCLFGYMAGAVIGGVFLVSHHLRTLLKRS